MPAYKIYSFDFWLLFFSLSLSIIGILNLYSAAPWCIFVKQFIWLFVGLFIVFFLFLLDYKTLKIYAYHIFIFFSLLLFSLLFKEDTIAGTRRWFSFSYFSFQPSEMAKIAFCITISKYFSNKYLEFKYNFKDIFMPLSFTVLYMYLVFLEPNLSTAVVFGLVFLSTILFLRINFSFLFYLTGFSFFLFPLFWFFLLKDYQKKRIFCFFSPGNDPLGTGYHIMQSKIAIGSGSFFGKGFLNGTQSQLRFLPEQYTDFAFSVLGEEWGFLGCLFVILLYIGIIYRCLKTADSINDPFGIILTISLTSIIFWQFFINIGMITGLLPVVGIPLPFISYGGSSLISSFLIIGIILNIKARNFLF